MADNQVQDFVKSIAGARMMAGAAESTIAETIQRSPTTHVRIPILQAVTVVGASVVLLTTWGVSAWIMAIILGEYISGALAAAAVVTGYLLLMAPVTWAGLALITRMLKDLAKPLGWVSPLESAQIDRFDELLGLTGGDEEEPEERVITMRSRSVKQPHRNKQARESKLALFLAVTRKHGTTLAVTKKHGIGRTKAEEYRDVVIKGGYADWKVKNAEGVPATTHGWAYHEDVTIKELLESLGER